MSARLQRNPGSAPRNARQVSQASTYSIYSAGPPSMTRTSSEQVMETLDTPVDEYFPPSASFGRNQPTRSNAYEGSRLKIRGDISTHRHTSDCSLSVLNHHDLTPLDRPSSLQCRRSTRELISKYEAISSPRGTLSAHPAHQSLLTPPIFPSFQRRNSPLPDLPSPTKPKAQTSFSFRNLLTVFGKRNKSPKRTQPEAHVSNAKPEDPPTEDVFFSAPPSSRTGPALYLSSSTCPPTWRSCSLTLHSSHLALTFSEDARCITRTIPLLYCVDVASLASHQLGHTIPTPRIGGDREMDKVAYVFEMTFEGCEPTKERLAAWSVAERSRWVSATWDAILACRDPNTTDGGVRIASPNDVIRGPPLKVVNGISQPSSSTSSPSLAALRPAPSEHAEIRDARSPTSNISAPTTPTRPPRRRPSSETSPAPSTLPSSSSIQTLGSMSIVRRRLAKLDSQERSPYACSLARGISSSGSYVASSMKRQQPAVEKEVRCDSHAYASKPAERLERSGTTTTTLSNDGASQETTFTALDAHAMYYEPGDVVDAESTNSRAQMGGTMKLDRLNRNLGRSTEGVEGLEQNMHSLLTSFHEHAAEQSSRASSFVDRLTSLDDGVGAIITNLKALPQSTSEADMAVVHAKLDQIKNDIATIDIGTMRAFFEEAASALRPPSPVGSNKPANGSFCEQPFAKPDLSPILMKFEELRGSLNSDLRLAIQQHEKTGVPNMVSTDMTPVLAKLEDIVEIVNTSSEARSTSADFTDIHTKLDRLIALCTTLTDQSKDPVDSAPEEMVMHNVSRSEDSKEESEDGPQGTCTDGETEGGTITRETIADPEQVTKLLKMLQDDQVSREMQAKQQEDSVRYLNELNTWLENFVASSVGNMRQVATGVDRLCGEWLPVTEIETDADSSDLQTNENKDSRSPENTFVSLQRFLAKQKGKGEDARNLQAAIQGLTETLKEDMAKNAEARFEMVRHAQAQESLLNGLAAELTKEIRGERLRFVDAMKDATSVNVAIHVEEFKKVLGRLHHEKMFLEQQIAELFSFVARQRQSHPPQSDKGTPEVYRPRPLPLPQINNQKSTPGYVVGGTKP